MKKSFIEILLIILLVPMLLTTFAQICFRYILGNPPSWTEELARFLFIWLCFLGAAYAFREKEHVSLDMIQNIIPPSLMRFYKGFRTGIVALLLILTIYAGIQSAITTYGMHSSTLDLNLAYVNAAIPVSGLFMLYYIIRSIFKE